METWRRLCRSRRRKVCVVLKKTWGFKHRRLKVNQRILFNVFRFILLDNQNEL